MLRSSYDTSGRDEGRGGEVEVLVVCPLRAPPAVALHPEPAGGGQSAPMTRKLRALIVEDEFIIALEIEMMLAELGIEVVGSANTAERALQLAADMRPDFVTMDIKLASERDGISVATEIFDTHGIRSIFVSAYKDSELFERAQAAKPLGWVRKPVSLGALRAALPKGGGLH
jgi:two-component system, response regulator PdtaR